MRFTWIWLEVQEEEREREGGEVPACLHVAVAHIASSATFALSALSAYLGQSIEISMQVGCALASRGVYVTPRSIICTEDSISIAFVSRVA